MTPSLTPNLGPFLVSFAFEQKKGEQGLAFLVTMGRGGHGGHHHSHSHSKSHAASEIDPMIETKRVRAKLITATVFAFIFMCIEIAGGYIAGSLAIVTDAAHLFTDIANFITAILASHLAIQPASVTLSYGEQFVNTFFL